VGPNGDSSAFMMAMFILLYLLQIYIGNMQGGFLLIKKWKNEIYELFLIGCMYTFYQNETPRWHETPRWRPIYTYLSYKKTSHKNKCFITLNFEWKEITNTNIISSYNFSVKLLSTLWIALKHNSYRFWK
jgi:hypothetical protein